MRYHDILIETVPLIQSGTKHIDDLPPELHEQAVKAFEQLAVGQRHGPPEKLGGASLNNRGIHVSGLYAGLTEHVGDITHRMAESWDFYHGGYGNVRTKVEYGMARISPRGWDWDIGTEIVNQVKRNYDYASHPDRNADHAKHKFEQPQFTGTLNDWRQWWKDAGNRYANAHASLTVYNEAQWHAREAAVWCGRLDWKAAYGHLRDLQTHLSSKADWIAYAGQVRIENARIVPLG